MAVSMPTSTRCSFRGQEEAEAMLTLRLLLARPFAGPCRADATLKDSKWSPSLSPSRADAAPSAALSLSLFAAAAGRNVRGGAAALADAVRLSRLPARLARWEVVALLRLVNAPAPPVGSMVSSGGISGKSMARMTVYAPRPISRISCQAQAEQAQKQVQSQKTLLEQPAEFSDSRRLQADVITPSKIILRRRVQTAWLCNPIKNAATAAPYVLIICVNPSGSHTFHKLTSISEHPGKFKRHCIQDARLEQSPICTAGRHQEPAQYHTCIACSLDICWQHQGYNPSTRHGTKQQDTQAT